MSFDFTDNSTNGAGTSKVFDWNGTLADLLVADVPPRFQSSANTALTASTLDGVYIIGVNNDASAFFKIAPADGGSPARSYSFPYINSTPTETTGETTLVQASSLPDNTDVILTVLFTVNSNGVQYSISTVVDNDLARLAPDEIRQLRSAEPVTGGGDVAFGVWVNQTTGDYNYSLDVDGGGKTLDQVSAIVRTLV